MCLLPIRAISMVTPASWVTYAHVCFPVVMSKIYNQIDNEIEHRLHGALKTPNMHICCRPKSAEG